MDFNTAEDIKRQINIESEITYIDVLGLENTIKVEDIRKVIKPIVSK